MNNFFVLLAGELQRLKKYNILAASMMVSVIWIGLLHFLEIRDVSKLLPLMLYVDATAMSMLLVGVTMFFEKQEGTLRSLLVSPINKAEYILAKTCANIVSNIETLALLYVYARIFKEIHVNILGLLGALILIAFFHSLVGFYMTYYSKGFTDLLVAMVKYTLVLMVPVLLEQLGLIRSELFSKLLYVIPTKASMTLMQASTGGVAVWEVVVSVLYMTIGSALLYYFVAKKFDEFAIKESGV